jgi:hypothetical protein
MCFTTLCPSATVAVRENDDIARHNLNSRRRLTGHALSGRYKAQWVEGSGSGEDYLTD